jgi:hypothetical protein
MVLVVIVAAVTYAASVPSDFAFEDGEDIIDNPYVQGTIPAREFASRRIHGEYRPLALVLFRAEWSAFSGVPWLFHTTNVAIHVGVMALVYMVLSGLSSEPVVLAAALFCAVFAASSEAVEAIAGQPDIASTGAILLGLVAHRQRGRGAAAFATVGLGVALGLAGTAWLAVVAWALLDVLLPSEVPVRDRRGRFVGYAAVVVAWLGLRFHAEGGGASQGSVPNPLVMNGTLDRVLGAGHILITRYIAGFIDPTRRLFDCSYRACAPSAPSDPLGWLGVGVAVALLLTAFVLRRRSPVASAGLFWFLIFFLPVSNLIVPAATAYRERLLYLPMVGVGLAVAVGFQSLARRWPRPTLAWVLFATLLVGNASAVQFRHGDWRTSAALARSALSLAGNSASVLAMNALDAVSLGDLQTAEAQARRSIEIEDSSPYGHDALAAVLNRQGHADAAEKEFRLAFRFGDRGDICVDYAAFLSEHHRFGEALELVRQQRKKGPDSRQLTQVEHFLEQTMAADRAPTMPRPGKPNPDSTTAPR